MLPMSQNKKKRLNSDIFNLNTSQNFMVTTPVKLHRRDDKRSSSNLIKVRSSYKHLSLFSKNKINRSGDKNSQFRGIKNKISQDIEISKLAGIKSVTSLGAQEEIKKNRNSNGQQEDEEVDENQDMKLFSGTMNDVTEDERITSTIYNEDNSRNISQNTIQDAQIGLGERTRVINKTPIISLKTGEGGSRQSVLSKRSLIDYQSKDSCQRSAIE